jgi:hypothetical protein
MSSSRNSNGVLRREAGEVCVGKDNEGVGLGDDVWLCCNLGGTTWRRLQFSNIRIQMVFERK